MTYEIALKLKLAKYPQSLTKEAEYYLAPNTLVLRKDLFQDIFHDSPKEMTTTNIFVYKPRLEELIEATDATTLDKIVSTPNGNVWQADKDTKGSTPSEAVANLWLKLNE